MWAGLAHFLQVQIALFHPSRPSVSLCRGSEGITSSALCRRPEHILEHPAETCTASVQTQMPCSWEDVLGMPGRQLSLQVQDDVLCAGCASSAKEPNGMDTSAQDACMEWPASKNSWSVSLCPVEAWMDLPVQSSQSSFGTSAAGPGLRQNASPLEKSMRTDCWVCNSRSNNTCQHMTCGPVQHRSESCIGTKPGIAGRGCSDMHRAGPGLGLTGFSLMFPPDYVNT